jgi:hypothetical protein
MEDGEARQPRLASAAQASQLNLVADNDPDQASTESRYITKLAQFGIACPKAAKARGPYSNTKDQFKALEELREKLPSLDTPEPPSIKRDRPGRARQLGARASRAADCRLSVRRDGV